MITTKQKLILDFDSTITDSIKAYCTTYSQLYSINPNYIKPNPDLVKQWNLQDQCFLEKHTESIFSSKLFFKNLEFFPKAKEIIKELSNKYEIIICSIGTYNNIYHKTEWIKDNLPFIHRFIGLVDDEHCFMDKSIVNMKNAIFLDDNKNNLDSSNAELKICYGKEYPWNDKWIGLRTFDWQEVEKLLLK